RRLAFATPQGAATAAAAVIDALVAAGRLARSGDTIRDSRRPLAVPAALATAMDRLEAVLSTPSPPPFRAAVAASACPVEGVRRLEAAGRIVRLGPDLAFASATYRELEALALSMADDGPLTPAAFRDATSSSRRYVLAILEDLDRRGLLVRTPDGHRRASGVSR
ncbi:MAG TPA: SelB C-terminal domain-containing protein, partial [Candidatus Dormibacteraeota bacterium]|nr:SelB C-terminal domain-containing protein [Candidatus Dormibacteraeota bacterium]